MLPLLEFVSIVLGHVMDHVGLKSFAMQTRSEVIATKQYYCTTIGYLVVIHQPDVTMQPQYRNYAQQVPQRSPHAANQRRGGIGKSAHFRPLPPKCERLTSVRANDVVWSPSLCAINASPDCPATASASSRPRACETPKPQAYR